MKVKMMQVGKIAYYEFRMHWRERALLVVLLAVAVLNVFSILIIASNTIPVEVDVNQMVNYMLAAPVSVTLALVLPIVVSNTIPKDTQWGVRELIDTLPVGQDVYYAGKVAGMWAAVLAGLMGVAAVTGILYRAIFGALDLRSYIEMWLVVGVLLVLLNGTLGVLVTATQPNRRRAALVMIAVFILAIFLGAEDFNTLSLQAYFNPIRPAIVMHYLGIIGSDISDWQAVALTVAAGVAELVGVVGLLWAWQRWQGRP